MQHEGSGVNGDTTTYVTADVIFPDDEDPGTPVVKVIGIECLGEQSVPINQNLAQWRMLLDIDDKLATGAVTANVDPASAGATLEGSVLKLLRNQNALRNIGLGRTQVLLGYEKAAPGEFKYPVTLEFQTVNDN